MSSVGSDSDSSDASSDDDNNSDASNSDDDSSCSLSLHVDNLFSALRTESLHDMHEILSLEDDDGRTVIKDDDIHFVLSFAAEAEDGSVEACRVLWEYLSPRGRRRYFKSTLDKYGILHAAVERGDLEIVRLFIEEFKWNINQKNYDDQTPLCYAVDHLETARYLLENGANVNQGGQYGPLWNAVNANKTDMTRLLLVENHANPNLNRRPAGEEDSNQQQDPRRNTDLAIQNGNIEILRMLLECGAFVGHFADARSGALSLNVLLENPYKSLETKLSIARMLVEHALEDRATAEFIKDSFQFEVTRTNNDNNDQACRILLDAGFDPRMAMYCAIRANNLSTSQLLAHEYHVDPFLQGQDDENDEETAASPFLAAARLPDTTLFDYFLGHWNDRFSSTGNGKNSDGDYPIHVVCCDPHVSIQAITMLVNRHPDSLAVVDGEQGLLPFHFAANWGTSLDVIFFLLRHCPDALSHVGNNAAASATAAGHGQNDLDATAPALKKAKTSHDR